MTEPTQDVTPLPEHVELAYTKASKMISSLCTPRFTEGHRDWIMSIPADPEHDPDIILATALRLLRTELRASESARAKAESLRQQANADATTWKQKAEAAEDARAKAVGERDALIGKVECLHVLVDARGQTIDQERTRAESAESELVTLRSILAQREQSLEESQQAYHALFQEKAALQARIEGVGELHRAYWFENVRPIINAIGELSVQEAMDAVEGGLPK